MDSFFSRSWSIVKKGKTDKRERYNWRTVLEWYKKRTTGNLYPWHGHVLLCKQLHPHAIRATGINRGTLEDFAVQPDVYILYYACSTSKSFWSHHTLSILYLIHFLDELFHSLVPNQDNRTSRIHTWLSVHLSTDQNSIFFVRQRIFKMYITGMSIERCPASIILKNMLLHTTSLTSTGPGNRRGLYVPNDARN